MEDPLDREIDLGTRPQLELDEPRPRHALQTADLDREPATRRWPIVAMFLVFSVLTAMSVGFFLRSPRPTPVVEKNPGVDATIVDLPAVAPASPNAMAGKPAASTSAPASPNASTFAPAAQTATVDKTADKTADRPNVGRMLIRSTPADADVFVNGIARGKTPLVLRELALGSYTIRVARRGYAADERTLHVTARQPSASTTIDLRPAFAPGATAGKPEKSSVGLPTKAMGNSSATVGGLNVQSRPAGARVYINDRLAGSTPISIPRLPAGPATVRLEMDGYRLWSTKVRVSAGEQTRVAASLERR